jgi:hypothetical protein
MTPGGVEVGARGARAAALAGLALAATAPAQGHAQGRERLGVRGEVALSLPVGPQAARFVAGAGVGVAGSLHVAPWLALELGYRGQAFTSAVTDHGAFHALGAALELRPPLAQASGELALAGGLEAVVTGDLVRLGVSGRIGYELELYDQLGLGPFFGFQHIVQPDDAAQGGEDASFVFIGLSGSWHPRPAPPPADSDRDGDGILDTADQCPERAEDRDGYRDDNGCPDMDNDDDGFPDDVDRCPNAAEDINGDDDDDGCPEDELDAPANRGAGRAPPPAAAASGRR